MDGNVDEERIFCMGNNLKKEALRWYRDEVELHLEDWTFTTAMCALYARFVRAGTSRTAAKKYDSVRYQADGGVNSLYNRLLRYARRMAICPDDYSLARRFFDELPDDIHDRIVDIYRLTPERASIETLLSAALDVEDSTQYLSRNKSKATGQLQQTTPKPTTVTNNSNVRGPRTQDRRPQPHATSRPSVAAQSSDRRASAPTATHPRPAPADRRTTGAANGQAAPRDRPDIECWKCGKKGHFSNRCPSNPSPSNALRRFDLTAAKGDDAQGSEDVGTEPNGDEGATLVVEDGDPIVDNSGPAEYEESPLGSQYESGDDLEDMYTDYEDPNESDDGGTVERLCSMSIAQFYLDDEAPSTQNQELADELSRRPPSEGDEATIAGSETSEMPSLVTVSTPASPEPSPVPSTASSSTDSLRDQLEADYEGFEPHPDDDAFITSRFRASSGPLIHRYLNALETLAEVDERRRIRESNAVQDQLPSQRPRAIDRQRGELAQVRQQVAFVEEIAEFHTRQAQRAVELLHHLDFLARTDAPPPQISRMLDPMIELLSSWRVNLRQLLYGRFTADQQVRIDNTGDPDARGPSFRPALRAMVAHHDRGYRTAMRASSTTKERPAGRGRCMTVSVNIRGIDALVLLDTGSTINAISLDFVTVSGLQAFPLSTPFALQLGCSGSRSKVNFGVETTFNIGADRHPIYFDVANVDHYDVILGIPFMDEVGMILNFRDYTVTVGNQVLNALKGGGDAAARRRKVPRAVAKTPPKAPTSD